MGSGAFPGGYSAAPTQAGSGVCPFESLDRFDQAKLPDLCPGSQTSGRGALIMNANKQVHKGKA